MYFKVGRASGGFDRPDSIDFGAKILKLNKIEEENTSTIPDCL